MNPVLNPFRPGAGRRPPVLAGRDDILGSFDVVRQRVNSMREGDRSWVLNGLRGVGKTALLNELMTHVSHDGWIVVKVEVTAGTRLPVALSAALIKAMRTATGRHPVGKLTRLLAVFKAFSLKVDPAGVISLGVEVAEQRGLADSGRFTEDLAVLFDVLGETSRDLGIGTLILIDELQEATVEELTAINTAVHQINQGDPPLPVFVVGAGLPSLPALLAEATSYAERLYDFRTIGLLPETAAQAALTEPTTQRDVAWDPDALEQALEIARGYPYLLQVVGKHVWDAAVNTPITPDDVTVGGALARTEVDHGLYKSRWERATPAQRDLLRALADLAGNGTAQIGELAVRMKKRRTADLSVARGQLIAKGLVFAPERGLLAFTVPGMHDFIKRQD